MKQIKSTTKDLLNRVDTWEEDLNFELDYYSRDKSFNYKVVFFTGILAVIVLILFATKVI
jgi:hypothetical protein